MNGTVSSFSVIAFGEPSSPRTFSGYAVNLVRALGAQGLLRQQYSFKPRRWLDVARAAALYDAHRARFRPHISRSWMWSRAGVELMSRNLARDIRAREDRGAFLQIGTLVAVPRECGPHFMITDMTIPQARRAGQFEIARLGGRALNVAIAIQAERLQEAAHVYTFCQWTADSIVQDFGLPAEKVTVAYPGSNLSLPAALVEPKRPREILFVGIDWKRKGGPLLLDAFRIVRRALPDATLTIVGCDPKTDASGVIVEGYLARSDAAQFDRLARCYLRAACFCLPSLFDPFPNAIIEAASVGLPAVAIDNGSRREAILHGETGLLAARPDAASLSEALVKLLRDPGVAATMGCAAARRAQTQFTWAQTIRSLLAGAVSAPCPPA